MIKTGWLATKRAAAISPVVVAMAFIAQSAGVAADKSNAPSDADLIGHYYLHDVHEVGSELLLSANHRFAFGLSYGAMDQSAQGSWHAAEGTVILTADKLPEPSFSWAAGQPSRSQDCMDGIDRPAVLVICINVANSGLVGSNIKVTAQFSNGKIRSGVTGRTGKLAFVDRSEPTWRGSIVKRLQFEIDGAKGVVSPWLDLPQGAKSAIIKFDPGRLGQSAFESLNLRIDRSRGQADPALVMLDKNGNDGNGRYERQ